MNCDFLKILKAAFLCAAFLFVLQTNQLAHASTNAFDGVKQKATELLLQKKKSQAMQVISNFIKADAGNKIEANDFLVKIAQKFIYREAQEAYENSLNLTLENLKEATKSNDQCLAIEPQQLECLVQKARLLFRLKNYRAATAVINEIKELVPSSKYESWLDLILVKNEAEFKNKLIFKNIPEKSSEENFGLILLELDRSFAAKNYSRAKDILSYLDKNYSDWPDLLFYKNKIDSESTEEKLKSNYDVRSELLVQYSNKCKSISKTTARKFRYDFDLCLRGGS